MSKEEPAWKAELRENLDEEFISSGAEIFDLVVPYILAAEQRGFQAGVNKTGDSVGKLREQLKTARADALRAMAAELRTRFAPGLRPQDVWIDGWLTAADYVDPDMDAP